MNRPLTETDELLLVNQAINEFFEESINNATAIDASYRQLWETMYGWIRSGGKKLRPRMTLLSYKAFGGAETQSLIPVAAAQELLHLSLLIHDDIIDRDYKRYGTLNIAGRYKVAYSKFITDQDEQTHFAHSAAILAGDLMIAGAYQLIASSRLNSIDKATAQQLLSRSIFEVAGGELLDTESSFVPYTDGDALKIARYKTASYSFVTPLLTGASAAGATQNQLALLENFATSLGIAFQLVDDLLGVFGEEETTGKSTMSDITEGKRTFMVECAVNAMTIVEKNRFHKSFGNHKASDSDIEDVKQLLISTGAKKATEQKIRDYAVQSKESLSKLKLSEKYQEEFEKLIIAVTERAY
jgi:geranylgeranyl diphosphate synthase, type II